MQGLVNKQDGLLRNFKWGLTGESQEMLVENSRVVWRRQAQQGAPAKGVDLGGRWVLPAFVDAHCHVLPTGLDLKKLHLGACETREQVLDAVRYALRALPPGKWLHAVHYDQNRFADGQHIAMQDLDAISPQTPIILRHVSGHSSVVNSAALKAAGVDEGTPDPSGGTFVRDAAGRMTGVLLETAHERVTEAGPKASLEEMTEAILLAGERMSELGIGCASDMMTGRFDLAKELQAYRLASERGCKVRLRLYLQWSAVFGPRAMSAGDLNELQADMDPDRCRVAGIKVFADGAIGSGTAAIYGRYVSETVPRERGLAGVSDKAAQEVSGQLIYPAHRLESMLKTAHNAGYQLAIHSIGDYSTDVVLSALEKLGDASRHRVEHAMMLSDAQIERFARVGCWCVMQPEFLHRFGDVYVRQLGADRASRLKRFRSVAQAGIRLALSSDRPIVSGDPWLGVATAAHRPAQFDQEENLSVRDAIAAYTSSAAGANGDEAVMGSLKPGDLADFQVLECDPTAVGSRQAASTLRSDRLAAAP